MSDSWDGSIPFHEWKKQKTSRGGLTGIGQKNNQKQPKPKKKKLESQSEWRKEIIRRDGKRCKLCGSDYWLEAHHIIYKSQGGERTNPLNGIMLCKQCHMAIHARTIKFKKSDLHYTQVEYFESIGAVVFDSQNQPVEGRHLNNFC